MNYLENITILKGKWLYENGAIIADKICDEINYIVNDFLQKITTDTSGWDTLYLNPLDGNYWELIYEHSDLAGGGPPTLKIISKNEISNKYIV